MALRLEGKNPYGKKPDKDAGKLEHFLYALGLADIPISASPLAMAKGGLPSLVAASKVGKIKKLIEEASGKIDKVSEDVIKWIDKDGVKQTIDLTKRFGARQLGLSARQTGTNIREKFDSPRDNLLNPRMKDQGKLYRTTAEAKRAEEIAEAGKKGVKLGDLPSMKGERGSVGFGPPPPRPTTDQIEKLVDAEQKGLINQAADEPLEEYIARFMREHPEEARAIEAHPNANISGSVRSQMEADKRYNATKKLQGNKPTKGIPASMRGKSSPHFPIEDYGPGFEYPVKPPQGKIVAHKDKSEWGVDVEEQADDDVVFWLTGGTHRDGGSVSFHPDASGEFLEVGVVGLNENTQGRGVGTALYQEALRWAKAHGYKGLKSDPGMRNKRSNGLWENIKTGVDNEHPGYFNDPKDVKMYGGIPFKDEIAKYALGPMRTLMSMGEMSAPLRQGIKFMKTHPIRGAQSMKDMFRSTLSDKGLEKVNRESLKRLRGIDHEKIGLAYKDTGLRQIYANNVLEKLPIISHSERAYEGFMKSARSRRAQDLIKKSMPMRHKVRLADLINDQTGYGRLGQYKGQKAGKADFGNLEKSADELADWIWSPRYFASRAHQLNPINLLPGNLSRYGRMDNPAFREHWKDTLKDVAITGSGLYGLDKSGIADVNTDWRSTQFLRPKFGDTTVDVTGGAGSLIGRAGQAITGETSYDGKVRPKDRWGTAGRTLRSVLSPGAGAIVDLIPTAKGEQRTFMGKKTDAPMDAFDVLPDPIEKKLEEIPYGATAIEHTSPMWWGDVVDTTRRSTLPPLGQAAIGAAGFFGASGRTDEPAVFEPKKKGSKKKKDETVGGLF